MINKLFPDIRIHICTLNAKNFNFSDVIAPKVEQARSKDDGRAAAGREWGKGRGKTNKSNIIQVNLCIKYFSAFCSINHKSILFSSLWVFGQKEYI